MPQLDDQPPSRAHLRRQRVIEAARKLFADNGFHNTGIAQIARESGIAVGQLYRDFSCKEDVVAEIVGQNCAAFLEDEALINAVAARDSGAVRDWIVAFVDGPRPEERDDIQLLAEIMAEMARNPRIAQIFLDIHVRVLANLAEALAIIAPGDRMAERREVLADTIVTMAMGLIHHPVAREPQRTDQVVAAMRAMITQSLDMLAADAAACATIGCEAAPAV